MVRTGLTRKILSDEDEHLVGELNAGGGIAFSNPLFGLWYLFAEADLNVGGVLEDSYAFGLGASTGIIRRINSVWKVILAVEDTEYILGDTRNAFKASLQQNFTLSTQTSIAADLVARYVEGTYRPEAKLSFNWYF
jgi:hypothetical protein